MATLYELTGQYLKLLNMAAEADPEVFADTIEGVEGEIEDKADGYGKVIRELSGDIVKVQAEIDRLTDRKRTMVNNLAKLKDSLQASMEATGKRRIKTDMFSFWIQKNPPVVQVTDEKKIPKEFWKQPAPVLDKTELKKYLNQNGNQEYAELVQETSLRIK